MKISRAGALGMTVLLAACDAPRAQSDAPPATIDGFDEIKFGMSFDEAVTLVGVRQFSPLSLQECQTDRPIRGCMLNSADNLTSYRTISGVPYSISLSFNRFDKLTDISLQFVRRELDSPDQKISKGDCLSIHERSIDWLVQKTGAFDLDSKESANARTQAGTPYSVTGDESNLLATAEKQFPDSRRVLVISHFMPGNCNISIDYRDKEQIERWKLKPEEQAELDKIVEDVQ